MKYENWISLKYLSTKKDRFISVIKLVSIIGVAIGVMALIVVIGVMTGFDNDLRDKITGTNAHILIEKETGVKDFQEVRKKVLQVSGISGASAYIHGNIFVESLGHATAVAIRGIDPATEATVTKVDRYLKQGKFEDLQGDAIVIGSELANYFGYELGDTVALISPTSGLSGEGWRYNLKVVGIFTSGMYDYDRNLVLVNIRKAQTIFDFSENEVSGIAVKLKDIYEAKKVKEAVYEVLGYSFLVRTWIETNRNFFAALRLEKFAMFIILTLIVLVASFNIISTLIVTVTSKTKDIGILKSIGVPKNSIRRIFTLEGVAIGLLGTFWGLVGGVGLCTILKKYQFIKLPQEIYYIDRLPVIVEPSDILIIVSCALIISYVATIYPASKAANLEPVDALRYE